MGETVVKFHFTNFKLREKHFTTKTLIAKYQILKPGVKVLPALPSDAHIWSKQSR